MRVLGFLLLFVAQSATAAEGPMQVAFARFAYADTSAFQHSLEQRALEVRAGIERRLPRLPLSVLSDEAVAARTTRAPLPLAKPDDVVQVQAQTRIALAKINPGRPAVPPIRIAPAQSDPVAAAPVTTSEPIAPEPPPAPQRLASLPEPMHLLPKSDTAEPVATLPPAEESEVHHYAAPKRPRARSRSVSQASRSAPRPAKASAPEKESPSKIPRWAKQMYDSNWQNQLFSYQR